MQDTDISVNVMKENANFFVEQISPQFNEGICSSKYPESFKFANIIPPQNCTLNTYNIVLTSTKIYFPKKKNSRSFYTTCKKYNGNSFGIVFCYIARVVSGIWMQLSFFANGLLWASAVNLGLKRPASSCKQVVFAAGVQKKPKRLRVLKVAKGTWRVFK